MPTAMARETAEIPAAAARLLAAGRPFAEAVAAVRAFAPRLVVICGRGSSGHAGLHLRYLVEARLGLPVSLAAPAVVTAYGRTPAADGALFVVVSQSGRSPDLVAATEAARRGGALTLALVNDDASPVAAAAGHVIPLAAGPERAVAATKSVVCAMLAGVRLVADWADDRGLRSAADAMPGRLAAALALDWSAWGEGLGRARAAFVTGRGYALGPALELALKLSETLQVPALGYSAAELQHGPRAAIGVDTPVLALRQSDPAAAAVDTLRAALEAAGHPIHVAGGLDGTLPWIGDGDPACDPVCMLAPAYRAIERAARAMGLDPDRPPFLSKVTRTL